MGREAAVRNHIVYKETKNVVPVLPKKNQLGLRLSILFNKKILTLKSAQANNDNFLNILQKYSMILLT